jgi:streptomycin 6-kinase
MRVEFWNPHIADEALKEVAMARALDAAYLLKDRVVQRLRSEIGATGAKPINRGVYKRIYPKGKYHYTGIWWTARRAGQLLESCRVVRRMKKDVSGNNIFEKDNIWVMVGNKAAYYAEIFEFKRPFFRPTVDASIQEIRSAMGLE